MSPAPVYGKEDCFAVELPDQTPDMHREIISRVVAWPDRIGFAVDRESDRQEAALVEFPADHAVVWLPRDAFGSLAPDAQEALALRVFREWARL